VILVNGRRVHHRNLAFALEQAYRGLRQPDRFPLAVIDLRVDPGDVDVNVHPSKREVRFRHEGAMFSAVERACYHALRRSPLYELQSAAGGPLLAVRESAELSNAPALPHPHHPPEGGREIDVARLPPLAYVGQLLNGYLVAEAPGAMALIDQHAAHERVLFDRIRRQLEEGQPSSQLLLIPHVVDLTPPQVAAFEQHAAWLATLGFEGERFGPHTVRIRAAPSHMPEARVERALDLLLTDLAGERTPDRRLRETAALIACHSAVRFGDAMNSESARQLLSSLAATTEPISCPHGRPTTLILPDHQLRRLFKRP
jgi:DNA mismatch repair protein MutL